MYYRTGTYTELNRNDAKFVDIIHTDRGLIGGPTSSGHAGLTQFEKNRNKNFHFNHTDFYPNGGGRPQPRCGNAIWQFVSLAVGGTFNSIEKKR